MIEKALDEPDEATTMAGCLPGQLTIRLACAAGSAQPRRGDLDAVRGTKQLRGLYAAAF
jgi:hypothetical protein